MPLQIRELGFYKSAKHSANHNLYKVINAFKKEDSLARQKFHELVSGQSKSQIQKKLPDKTVERSINEVQQG